MLVNMSFWLAKMFTRKRLARKSCYNENIEYSPLGKELEAQTDIGKKQYQKLNNTAKF